MKLKLDIPLKDLSYIVLVFHRQQYQFRVFSMWKGALDIGLSPLVSWSDLEDLWRTIPPDAQLKKDIQAVQLTAKQGFLSALAIFKYRCFEKKIETL